MHNRANAMWGKGQCQCCSPLRHFTNTACHRTKSSNPSAAYVANPSSIPRTHCLPVDASLLCPDRLAATSAMCDRRGSYSWQIAITSGLPCARISKHQVADVRHCDMPGYQLPVVQTQVVQRTVLCFALSYAFNTAVLVSGAYWASVIASASLPCCPCLPALVECLAHLAHSVHNCALHMWQGRS
jgi:hypothetical protein